MWILLLSVPSFLVLWLAPYPINADEVQCYICTSYMSECTSTVDNTDHKVYKSKCNSKCFIRIGEDYAIYRGCFDGFTDVKQLQHDYNGCKNQTWNSKEMLWCFCDGDLCNGKSIKEFTKVTPTSSRYSNGHDHDHDGYDNEILNEGGYPVEAHSDGYDKTQEESTVHGAEFMKKKPSYKQLKKDQKPQTHPSRPDIHINAFIDKPSLQSSTNNPRYGNRRRFRPNFNENRNRGNDIYLPAHRQVEQYRPEPKKYESRDNDKQNLDIYRKDQHQEYKGNSDDNNPGYGYEEDGYRHREDYEPEYNQVDDYGKQYEREEYHPQTEYKKTEPQGKYNHGYKDASERQEEDGYNPDYHDEAYYREEYIPDNVHEDVERPNEKYQHKTFRKEPDLEAYPPREYNPKHESYPKEGKYHGEEDVYPQHEPHPQHETHPQREAYPEHEANPQRETHPQREAYPEHEANPQRETHPQHETHPQQEAYLQHETRSELKPYKIIDNYNHLERYDKEEDYEPQEKEDIYPKEDRRNNYDEIQRQDHSEDLYDHHENPPRYNVEQKQPIIEYVPVHYKPEKEIQETPHLPKKTEEKNEYENKQDPHVKPQNTHDEHYRPKEYEKKPDYVVHGKATEKKEGSYDEDDKEYEHRENDYPPNGKGDYIETPKIYVAPIPKMTENRHNPSNRHFVPKPYFAYGRFVGYRPPGRAYPPPPNGNYGRHGVHARNKEGKSDLASKVFCQKTGFYQNPDDCSSFVACIMDPHTSKPILYPMRCPGGLVWDNHRRTCLEYSETCKLGQTPKNI